MGDLLTGLVKGLSGFMPQDDPDVKIFNAQTEIKEINEKIEKVYARLGRELYQKDGGEGFPLIRAELDMLVANQAPACKDLSQWHRNASAPAVVTKLHLDRGSAQDAVPKWNSLKFDAYEKTDSIIFLYGFSVFVCWGRGAWR